MDLGAIDPTGLLLGLLFVALGLPLALGRVPPNAWYGFRVARTLRSRKVWYASNAYGGRLMAWLGALMTLFAVAAPGLPGMDAGRVAAGTIVLLLFGSLAVTGLWYNHLRTLDDPPGDPGPSAVAPAPKKLLVALYAFLGLLFIGVSVPMVMRQVPPNGSYGFRTPQTLASPEVWYAANAYSGWTMIGAGAVVFVAAIGLGLNRRISDGAYALAMTAVMLLSLGASLALSFRFLATAF